MQILEAQRDQSLRQIRIPFPDPQPEIDAKYTLAYSRPTNINVVGSHARRTAVQVDGVLVIDLAVTMPSCIFQPKDYLNYRYFHKRAFYLACIATGIKEAEDSDFTIQYTLQDSNKLQPVILISPREEDDYFRKSRCAIRIILAADSELFPIAKTLPSKNAIRHEALTKSRQLPQTPFYNASIRSECSSLVYLKFLHMVSVQSKHFASACILGSIWLRQRGLNRGGFGSFEWACTTALLMQNDGRRGGPLLSQGFSSYQLFKATLQYLVSIDLVMSPLLIRSNETVISTADNPMLFDGKTGLNLLFKMTPWSYSLLRYEARLTLKLLSDPLSDQFSACFITDVNDPLPRFDSVVRLPTFQLSLAANEETDAISNRLAYCRVLYQVLKTGLGDRSLLIHLENPPKVVWRPASRMPIVEGESSLLIGLLLSPEQVSRTVDRGPHAEDKEAATAFRNFWGEKAELRRFKEGSIQESLIWADPNSYDSIIQQIITYIIQRHIGYETSKELVFTEHLFGRPNPPFLGTIVDSKTLFQPNMDAFETLKRHIMGLEGLPLHIRQVSAIDPQLRYASVRSSMTDFAQNEQGPAGVIVQFEGSSRWPDDLSAIQRTKLAFLLKMGELLEESIVGLFARLGLGNVHDYPLESSYLDVIYPSGASFRLRIHHEHEINLLDRTLKSEVHTSATREAIICALSAHRRDFLQAPLHNQAICSLSTRFPLLSPSMRLMKRWRDSHLLSQHVSDELIELLTVCAFVRPYPWSVPASIMTGFLRTLNVISKWDWRFEPLIIDFKGDMGVQDIDAIRLRFEAWRKIDPAMNGVAMFAASNVDRNGVTWTETGPSKLVAARLTSLAKAACKLIKDQGTKMDPEALFVPSIGDYDFVIHLKPKYVRAEWAAGMQRQPVFKNLEIQDFEQKSLIESNLVRSYLSELRTLYSSSVLFFTNGPRVSVIAGLWNPQAGSRQWKVNLPYSTMPLLSPQNEGEYQVSINKTATLHEIGRLGGDMILRIEVREQHD